MRCLRCLIWLVSIFVVLLILLPIVVFIRAPHIVGTFMPFHSWEIGLPRGYSLIPISGGDNVCLAESGTVGRIIIGPKVKAYRVYSTKHSNIVVGYIGKSKHWDSRSGYFILVCDGGKLYKGLSNKQWISLLHSYGIHKQPTLHRPTGFDELKGYNRPVRL
ncbi:MAG: hypothetical protein ABFD64_07690 [Armatimonadota bacterium]